MNPSFQILIIEDEENICEFMKRVLTPQGYKVYITYNGRDGLSAISSTCPDLIILDLGLPDIDGISIIEKVREWSSSPIVVVSARTHENDKVLALDAGADDYITKPFGTSELLARIRTSLRHGNRLNKDSSITIRPYHAKDLFIDFDRRIITIDQKPIHLTPVEYKIVTYLARNSGKVLTYTSIMQAIWGPYIEEDTKILRVNMANIRRKLEHNPGVPQYIFTEIGVGYRMLDG